MGLSEKRKPRLWKWGSVGEGSVTGRVGQAGSGPGKVELSAGETTLMTRVSQEEAATLGPSIP